MRVTLQSDTLGRSVRMRISANALRTVEHRGGLDAFLAKAKTDELSQTARDVKREIEKKQMAETEARRRRPSEAPTLSFVLSDPERSAGRPHPGPPFAVEGPSVAMTALRARRPLEAPSSPSARWRRVVLASNILVQHPIQALGLQDWLTWGAFTYPFAFLVTDLANRRFGPAAARKVVYAGFALAGRAVDLFRDAPHRPSRRASPSCRRSSSTVAIFNALRARAWWIAPLTSSVVASALDTALFFSLAFACGPVVGETTITQMLGAVGIADECIALPWQTLAVADYLVKLAISAVALVPYGALVARMRRAEDGEGARGAA